MAPALDRLGGEVVRLRSRDGDPPHGRWLAADLEPEPAGAPAAEGDGAWVVDPREAILLLHGWSGSVTPDLLDVGPFLRRTAGVLGLDFRGHGGSDDAPTTFGLHEVEDVAGALAWLGERGIRRVALVGSSMGGITAIAAVAVLGDGRLAAADRDLDAPARHGRRPRARGSAPVVARLGARPSSPWSSRAGSGCRSGAGSRTRRSRAWPAAWAATRAPPSRSTSSGLLEDVPLLLVHGGADRTRADPATPNRARRGGSRGHAGTW